MKAIFDIGKTNIKLQLVHDSGALCENYARRNAAVNSHPYPHADVEGIWNWLLETLAACEYVTEIKAIVVTTHGATAALINNHEGLVLPVLDYEYTEINNCDELYQKKRPDYAETLSPDLPAGLNLGRQIFWLQNNFTEEFSHVTHILMYPQYWGWRLTGNLASEVTSLGCHTDLWSPTNNHYSSLVMESNWQNLFPPLRPAWDVLGKLSASVVASTGLPEDCDVFVGLHDSNASYLRYLSGMRTSSSFTVISTGTWTILMSARANLATLNSARDMLANCDVYGDPVVCARFMGGREYEMICQVLGGDVHSHCTAMDIQTAIDNQWFVTPDFSAGNGPFAGRSPTIHCPVPAPTPAAVATLYCALMIDQRLTDLNATGPLFIEGAFLKNSLLCELIAQYRSLQPLYLSADDTGTVQGALLLTRWGQRDEFVLPTQPCKPSRYTGLDVYKRGWYQAMEH